MASPYFQPSLSPAWEGQFEEWAPAFLDNPGIIYPNDLVPQGYQVMHPANDLSEPSAKTSDMISDAFNGDEMEMGISSGYSTYPIFRESTSPSLDVTPLGMFSGNHNAVAPGPISLSSSTSAAASSSLETISSAASGGRVRRASSTWSDLELSVLHGLVVQHTNVVGLTSWEPIWRGFRARFPNHNRKDRGLQMKVWRTWKIAGTSKRPQYKRNNKGGNEHGSQRGGKGGGKGVLKRYAQRGDRLSSSPSQ